MREKITLLGCGRVGKLIAHELCEAGFDLTVADNSAENLDALSSKVQEKARIERLDLSDREVILRVISDSELVVNALPGFLGFNVLGILVEKPIKVVDISFFPEDPRVLSPTAVSSGAQVVYDGGVAPGLSNLFVGSAKLELDKVSSVKIYVGGLPVKPTPPWFYKAFFSPIDVIEEYTRPVHIIRAGQPKTLSPLTEPEILEFDQVGKLEGFLTDGLRSLVHTVSADEMFEKTLRYPGHRELLEKLESVGLFSSDKIEIQGVLVRPVDLSAAIFTRDWSAKEDDGDLTIMRIEVTGLSGEQSMLHTLELLDFGKPQNQFSSMARTTGLTAVALVRELLESKVSAGMYAPEQFLSSAAQFRRIVENLTSHGVKIELTEKVL